MEQSVGSKIAVMVYHYFLERRMVDVAEMFAEKCVYLKEMKRSSYHCLLSSTPMQGIAWLLVEHETLLCNMKQLIRMYHGIAPLPFEATTWEKIQCLMQYLYERATLHSNTVADSPTKTTGHSQTMSTAGEREAENVYLLENNVPHQQAPSMQQENQNLLENACQPADRSSSMAEQTTVLYVATGSKEQIDKDTIVIRLDDDEIASNVQTDSVEDLITIDDDEVSIGQHIEVTTLMVEPVQLSSQSTVDENAAEEFANKENREPLPVPTASKPEFVQPNTAIEYVLNVSETTSTTSTVTAPEVTPAEENPSPPAQAPTSVKKKAIDPEALEEWKRMRSLNNRNFDNYIRQINRQHELMNDLRTEAKKSTTAKSKATPPKQNSRKTAPKPKQTPKCTKQSAQKQKVAAEPDKGENGVPSTKRPATKRPITDSESSDFASSTDEDEDVRVMSRRIRQYRAQKKRSRGKEKKSEESTGQQSNVFTSPSTLKQCRVNLIVGQRSTRKSPVKRGLRNRTPSTSPVGTPVKLSNPVTDSTAMPSSARRIGKARQQLLLSGKKAKEPTDHQKPVSMSVTAKQPPPAPVTLSPKNRRPVRACTVNRKPIVASTPLKQTVPKVDNGDAPALTTPEQKEESNVKYDSKPTTEPVPEANNPVTVDAGEAAIYAVLAQLHGDN